MSLHAHGGPRDTGIRFVGNVNACGLFLVLGEELKTTSGRPAHDHEKCGVPTEKLHLNLIDDILPLDSVGHSQILKLNPDKRAHPHDLNTKYIVFQKQI